MNANKAAAIVVFGVLGLTACATSPSLLHQRGTEIWVMNDAGKQAKLVTEGALPRWIWAGRSHIAFFRPGTPCDPGWANYIPQVYMTQVSAPGSIDVVSDFTAGAYTRPAWEGSSSIFFFDTFPLRKAFRYDVKSGSVQAIANVPSFVGDRYSVNAQFLYFGSSQGVKAIEWHLPNTVRNVGPGFNPER